jgi:hypothetical protein
VAQDSKIKSQRNFIFTMKNIKQKREEANQRKAIRAKRSNAAQIALLKTRGGEAKREVSRLSGKK